MEVERVQALRPLVNEKKKMEREIDVLKQDLRDIKQQYSATVGDKDAIWACYVSDGEISQTIYVMAPSREYIKAN